jgi:hypothetical protein
VGQQQLLLLVLGIVLVSLAVFMGIIFFNEMMRQRHADLLMNHAMHVASEAITWRTKVSPFLGGGGSYSDLDTDGMEKILMDPVRIPGTFQITKASGDDLEVTGVSNDYAEVGIRVVVKESEITETLIAYDGSITLPSAPAP